MSQHLIEITQDVRDQVQSVINAVHAKRELGELEPRYEDFVNNRFKYMADPASSLHHAATGCSTEGGEILDCSKKVWVYERELDLGNLLEEMGDLRFYYQTILNMLQMTDADIQALNMNKLAVRYPLGKYTNEHAAARLDKQGEE